MKAVMKKGKLRPAFKIHGGKHYLANWIIEQFPPNYRELVYVEPYCGAANVLLSKDPSREEYLNDLDPGVISILRTLRDRCPDYVSHLKRIEYKKENFEKALAKTTFTNDLDFAINEFILRRMSRDGLKKAFAWSDRKRGGQPGDVNAWQTILSQLHLIAERLNHILIFNSLALNVINAFNEPDVLIYCDPTYLPDTRVSKDAYEFEMNLDDHLELAEELNTFKGKVVLSGYPSNLYSRLYSNWQCVKKQIANHSSQQKKKQVKTECLWKNY